MQPDATYCDVMQSDPKRRKAMQSDAMQYNAKQHNARQPNAKHRGKAAITRNTGRGSSAAGVVQWQNGSFPSCIRGFDSLHPLQNFYAAQIKPK